MIPIPITNLTLYLTVQHQLHKTVKLNITQELMKMFIRAQSSAPTVNLLRVMQVLLLKESVRALPHLLLSAVSVRRLAVIRATAMQ